jgi:hypothetical protein
MSATGAGNLAATGAAPLAPVADTVSAWLAAYAMGLTYSSHAASERAACLRHAASPHPGGLEAAHHRLELAEVAEPPHQQEALQLLERALQSPPLHT